jgi:hypothetical protein
VSAATQPDRSRCPLPLTDRSRTAVVDAGGAARHSRTTHETRRPAVSSALVSCSATARAARSSAVRSSRPARRRWPVSWSAAAGSCGSVASTGTSSAAATSPAGRALAHQQQDGRCAGRDEPGERGPQVLELVEAGAGHQHEHVSGGGQRRGRRAGPQPAAVDQHVPVRIAAQFGGERPPSSCSAGWRARRRPARPAPATRPAAAGCAGPARPLGASDGRPRRGSSAPARTAAGAGREAAAVRVRLDQQQRPLVRPGRAPAPAARSSPPATP